MKRARFTDEQIVRILQEADRSPVAEAGPASITCPGKNSTKRISQLSRRQK